MSNNYSCPECKSKINIGNSLVLSAKSPSNDRGLIFLDTELGNYTKTTHPDFKLQEGVEYKFYCPVCHFKLNLADRFNLVKIHMSDETGKEVEILISNIIGEHCTYKIQEKKVDAYGPDAKRYSQYLDLPPEYHKYL
ncbi:MAG: hypothetical protein P1P86_01285 [Bacteroidales bacterium]|nr:hypothetical protein [Bacteroidales bacterium]